MIAIIIRLILLSFNKLVYNINSSIIFNPPDIQTFKWKLKKKININNNKKNNGLNQTNLNE